MVKPTHAKWAQALSDFTLVMTQQTGARKKAIVSKLRADAEARQDRSRRQPAAPRAAADTGDIPLTHGPPPPAFFLMASSRVTEN